MGLLWEIVQTGLIYGQSRKANTIEERVQSLEEHLVATQNTLRSLVKKLEEMQGVDIDGDGKIG
jgi:bisphosphoglycerate-dependent phosphoglycerate mutase